MNRMIRQIIFMVAIAFLVTDFSSCTPDSYVEGASESPTDSLQASDAFSGGCRTVSGKETVTVAGLTVDIQAPEDQYQGDLLILHAWDETQSSWCLRSRICSKAAARGYRIIMPAMGKSIYTRKNYPESRPDWQQYPTATFFTDTLLPALRREYCLLEDNGYNFVIGVSAGARGAVRLIQDLPDLFVSAAALSGEYDPSQMKRDNIYRGFLGNYEDHPERWEKDENLNTSVHGMRTPLYLGHGRRDDFVPSSQSERFYNVLREEVPDLNVRLNLSPDRGGSYAFWNYEINNIFRFFDQAQADLPEGP